MPWIKVVDQEAATGHLKEVYEKVAGRRGKVANILKIHSLNPAAMNSHMDLYLSIMFGETRLSREESEIIAVAVSAANNCEYCVAHHAEALQHYWKDRERIQRLCSDLDSAGLDERSLALARYAAKLTTSPHLMSEHDVAGLRRVGLGDEEILNVNLISSYFNFVNRVALGLGVPFSAEEVEGYKF